MRAILAPAAAVGISAGAAGADFIHVESTGTFSVVSIDEDAMVLSFATTVTSQVGGLGLLEADGTISQLFDDVDITDDMGGSATWTGPGDLDTITIDFEGLFFAISAENASFAGIWSITGAAGTHAGLVGGGDLSGWYYFTSSDSGQFGFTIQGDVVPAPAAAAVITLGGLLATRRRR